MKEIVLLPLEFIMEIFEEILETGIDACPPLLIFLFVTCFLMSDGCLPKIGGILLIPIGIIALVIWFFL